MPGGTNLCVLGDLGYSSQTPYPYEAYSPPTICRSHLVAADIVVKTQEKLLQ